MQAKLHCVVFTLSMIILCMTILPMEAKEKRRVIGARRLSYAPLFPTGCDGNLCNHTLNYPKKKLANFLRKHRIFEGESVHIKTNDDIASRQFDEEDGINMCETSQAYMRPEAARAEDGQMMFIVNNIRNYSQTIEYDKCSSRMGCMFSSHFPDDYSTSCKQHKISLKLLSMDHRGETKMRSFWIPGGCACVYKLQKK